MSIYTHMRLQSDCQYWLAISANQWAGWLEICFIKAEHGCHNPTAWNSSRETCDLFLWHGIQVGAVWHNIRCIKWPWTVVDHTILALQLSGSTPTGSSSHFSQFISTRLRMHLWCSRQLLHGAWSQWPWNLFERYMHVVESDKLIYEGNCKVNLAENKSSMWKTSSNFYVFERMKWSRGQCAHFAPDRFIYNHCESPWFDKSLEYCFSFSSLGCVFGTTFDNSQKQLQPIQWKPESELIIIGIGLNNIAFLFLSRGGCGIGLGGMC